MLRSLGAFGQGTDTHSRIGDDNVRCTDAPKEVLCSILYGRCIAHVQCIGMNPVWVSLGKGMQQFGTAGDRPDHRALFKVVSCQRPAKATRLPGDDQRLDMRLLHV
jgi:hypothetical protein